MQTTDKRVLESMIDKGNVREVMEAIAEICDDKSEHILRNWQDSPLSKQWERAAKAARRAARDFGRLPAVPGINRL